MVASESVDGVVSESVDGEGKESVDGGVGKESVDAVCQETGCDVS